MSEEFTMLLLGALGAPLALAMIAPVIIVRLKEKHSTDAARARFFIYIAAATGFVVLMWRLGISFVPHFLNVAAGAIALLGSWALVIFSFQIKPSWLGGLIGTLSTISLLLVTLLQLAWLAWPIANLPPLVKGTDSTYCRSFYYGWAGAGGTEIQAFKRYLFIDQKILDLNFPDVGTGDTLNRSEADILAHCDQASLYPR